MLSAGCSDAPGAFLFCIAVFEGGICPFLPVLLLQEYEIYSKYKEYYGYKMVPLQCLSLEEYRYYHAEYHARYYLLDNL